MKKLVWALVFVLCFGSLALAGAGQHGAFEGFPIVRVLVNGQEVVSDVPAVNFHGRTMVPVRFVAETLGYSVEWNERTWTATISSSASEDWYRDIVVGLNGSMASTIELCHDMLEGKRTNLSMQALEVYRPLVGNVLKVVPPADYEALHRAMCEVLLMTEHQLSMVANLPDDPAQRLEALRAGRDHSTGMEVAVARFYAEASAKGINLELRRRWHVLARRHDLPSGLAGDTYRGHPGISACG